MSENVYLIFSVNNSGEFFGYARMASEIVDSSSSDASRAQERGHQSSASDPPVVLAGPKTTVTPRTSTAPRGKIFEDEVCGTIFWEIAESSEEEEVEGLPPRGDDKWGNLFRIEWIKWFVSCLV